MSISEALKVYETGVQFIEEDMSLEKLLQGGSFLNMQAQSDLNQQRSAQASENNNNRFNDKAELRVIDILDMEIANCGHDLPNDCGSVSENQRLNKNNNMSNNLSAVQMISFDSNQQNEP